ncbi:MAG: hypothetical protein RJA83_672 [Pseudomonadota bacterium]|jgi:hypothetical protein
MIHAKKLFFTLYKTQETNIEYIPKDNGKLSKILTTK